MTYLTSINDNNRIVWNDFTVKDSNATSSLIDIDSVSFSEKGKLVALNFSNYRGYTETAYGEGSVSTGITEQQAYDTWSLILQAEQRKYRKRLKEIGINALPQSVYDGLFLYHWITMKETIVTSLEGLYDFKDALIRKDYSTVASMIARSSMNKLKCIQAATIIMLADYGKNKSRSQLRSEGLFNIRSKNEQNQFTTTQLNRARFAYYAETLKFLPKTPEGIKRDIAKRYEETLTAYRFVYDGSTTSFDINTEPSLDPVVKVEVTVNDEPLQLYFDFNLVGTNINISKSLNVNDIIFVKIKI